VTARSGGFTILELLIAAAVMTILCGAFVSLIAAWQSIARVQPDVAELQQRARIAVAALSSDIARAGAGVDRGPLAGPLSRHFAAIEPGADGAITIWYVSSRAAQTALTVPLLRGETAAGVAEGAGFARDSTAIVFDADGCHDAVRVEDVAGPTILLRAASRRCDYARGAAFAQAEVRTYRVDRAERQLLRRDEATGLSVPVVDGIASMSVEYLDGGRRARIVLTVSSAADRPAVEALSVAFDVVAPNLWLS
jgi:type II secretory pathway pseudopilin PulG